VAAAILAAGAWEAVAVEPRGKQHWLPATPEKLPRWRGFNLLEKFQRTGRRTPFVEDDFRLIAKLGFNFVRLPMDYRGWIKGGDWLQFDEYALGQIDQAVAWGAKYGIHVCINFHRAPGYSVASPPEKTSLWTDPATQNVAARHWAMFARRYRGIPNERLSFNLLNEPADIPADVYAEVVRKLTAAIRAEDPDRLIIADGLKWGTTPVVQLAGLGIAQATRGYSPFEISHYKASWVDSSHFAAPRWPCRLPPNGTLLGPKKTEGSYPLVIDGPMAVDTALRLHVLTVSEEALLVVEADDERIFEKQFECGPGTGEWKKSQFNDRYKIYQNLFDKDYAVTIPAGTRQVRILVADGDWLEIGELGLKPTVDGAKEAVLAFEQAFGKKQEPLRYAPEAAGGPLLGVPMADRSYLWKTCIMPWKEPELKGVGMMVGEWGAYNRTPHDVVLHWAEDCLANWREAGWGWAMWNFRGPFGVLDSGRTDVRYENFEGHRLDRKLLNLLQKY
jgi:hypothetical protein